MKKLLALLMVGMMAIAFCACGDTSSEEASDDNAAKLESFNIEKVADYLYSIEISDYDYEAMAPELDEIFKGGGGCASVVNGDFFGRNLDWNYDDDAYFVIKTPATKDRHAVLGVAGLIEGLTADVVDSGEWNDGYDLVPFDTLDGINDAGLVANVLVVPNGICEATTGTNPEGENLCATALVRQVLDNCSNVDEAIDFIKSKNVYAPHSDEMSQEFHWRIADLEKDVVVELVDNEVKVLEDQPVVTNFYLSDYDGVNMPDDPEGIERFNILKENYDQGATKEGMIKLMESVNFSQAYDLNTVPFWYSEQETIKGCTSADYGDPDLSDGDLSKAGPWEKMIPQTIENYKMGRQKMGESQAWITCYTSVYDMAKKTMTVVPQESGEEYDFSL